MGDTGDVLNRLRAMLDHGPKPPSRYDPPRVEEKVDREVENLKKENRLLKRDNEDLKRQLDSSEQYSQAEISSHREILTQASEALIRSTSEITSLKLEIKDQSSLVQEERQKRQVAESVANGSKTQLSQIAREKHELELRVKRAEGAEVELKRLTEVNRNLEISNVSLRKQITSGASQFQTRAIIDGLQEKAKTAELKVAKLSDQLRHVRLQNDALRIQVEEHTGQEDVVQKLMSEKGAYKNALKEKELEIMKLAEKLEDQKKQNRAYVEQFKAQERESQRYRSKKKERAFLKAIPIIPPTPALLIPTQAHEPRPSDLTVLSECSDTPTDFSEDLRTLDDLTGRQHGRREDSDLTHKARKVRDTGSAHHRVPFFNVDGIEKTPNPRRGGSMDDLVREIKQMTIKKSDPYGDIEKAFGLDPPGPKKSMAATVEDEDEPPRQRVVRKGSPLNTRAERYGDAYA